MANGPMSAARMRYSRLRPERLAAIREQQAQNQVEVEHDEQGPEVAPARSQGSTVGGDRR